MRKAGKETNLAAGAAPLCARAQAQPNIALVKYWGKRDVGLNLPAVGSLSITLESLHTLTSVCFDAALAADEFLLGGVQQPAAAKRVSACLDLLRAEAGVNLHARVESRNSFPTAAGLASSASGFAALVLAAAHAIGLETDRTRLSELARRASGSAGRSLFGGFVQMHHGSRTDGADAVAEPLLAAQEWPLEVVIGITSTRAKDVGSTVGMNRSAHSSPYFAAWTATGEDDLAEARAAIAKRDFSALAEISEYSCLKFHAAALSARPGLLYWNGATMECLHRIRALRAAGTPVFFTVDAGPQVKAVCLPEAAAAVADALGDVKGVESLLRSGLGEGARLLEPDP